MVGMIDDFEDIDVLHILLQSVVVHAPLFELRRTMPDTASPKPMLLRMAAPRVAPSGRSVVGPAGLEPATKRL